MANFVFVVREDDAVWIDGVRKRDVPAWIAKMPAVDFRGYVLVEPDGSIVWKREGHMNDIYWSALAAELDAYIEDRERTIGALIGELVTYERIVNEYDATLVAQSERIQYMKLALKASELYAKELGASRDTESFIEQSEAIKALRSQMFDQQIVADESREENQAQQVKITELATAIANLTMQSEAAFLLFQRRIAELERQLTAAIATIEQAAWCNECGLPIDHCRENHASGSDLITGAFASLSGQHVYLSLRAETVAAATDVAIVAAVRKLAADAMRVAGDFEVQIATGPDYAEGCAP